jgi:hypothetical protein
MLRRIAADATIAAEIETGGGIPLTGADGLIWGARADEIWAVDPATNKVSRHVPLVDVDEILAMDVGDGEAWVAVRRPGRIGRVLAVELATGATTAEYAVSLPAAVELTAQTAWVTDYESDEVLGFDR